MAKTSTPLLCFKISFKGRVPRRTFWLTFLLMILVIAPVSRVLAFFMTLDTFLLVSIYMQVWGLSLQVRRLHDIGASGWWAAPIAIIGELTLLSLLTLLSYSELICAPMCEDVETVQAILITQGAFLIGASGWWAAPIAIIGVLTLLSYSELICAPMYEDVETVQAILIIQGAFLLILSVLFFILGLVYIVVSCFRSAPGTNKWGPNPYEKPEYEQLGANHRGSGVNSPAPRKLVRKNAAPRQAAQQPNMQPSAAAYVPQQQNAYYAQQQNAYYAQQQIPGSYVPQQQLYQTPDAVKNYYVMVNQQQVGPFSAAELIGMISSLQLPADTPVWKEGMAQWVPYNQLSPLS